MRTPGQAAIQRAQKMLGREFDVINYTFDDSAGSNAYADGDWIATEDSPQTVAVTIDFGSVNNRGGGSGRGVTVEHDAVIYVAPDRVTIRDGTDDETRGTEFVDTENDVTYNAVSVEHQLHLVAVHVEEI